MDRQYATRSLNLRRIGYSSYAAYLQSDLWRTIRTKILKRDRYKCIRCGQTASQVHHCNYRKSTLLGKVPEALVAVCRDCHRGAEFAGTRKTGVREASVALGFRTVRVCACCGREKSWVRFYRSSVDVCKLCYVKKRVDRKARQGTGTAVTAADAQGESMRVNGDPTGVGTNPAGPG